MDDEFNCYGVFYFTDGKWVELPCIKIEREQAGSVMSLFTQPLMFVWWDRESQQYIFDKELTTIFGRPCEEVILKRYSNF